MRKITYWLSLILVFMIPWEDSASLSTFGSLAKVMGIGVAGFWVIGILIEGRFRKPNLFHVFVLMFFLWNAVSIFWSPFGDGTLQRIKTYSQIFLLMLILWEMYQKPLELTAALQAYIFGAFVLIYSSVSNYINGAVAVEYEGRYSATGVNAVDMTLILLLGLPIALQLFYVDISERKSIVIKILNIVYIPLAIFSILLTGSRTSLIAIIPFCIYLVGTQRIKFEQKLLIFAILLVSLLALLPFIPQSVIARLGTIGDSIGEGDLGGRVTLWQEGIAVLAQHPMFGIGGGAIDYTIGSAVHNTFISVATETGFVGFVIFLSILGLAVYKAALLPKGTSGLWLAIIMTWAIGVLSLSWEFRKVTWIMLSFVIIESSLGDQASKQDEKIHLPEGAKPSFETSGLASQLKAIHVDR